MSTGASQPVYLIATDGGESSAGAVRLGLLAAERLKGTVELATIGDRAAGGRVRSLVDRLSSSPWSWSHVQFPGTLAAGLVHATVERRATMLLIGAGGDSGNTVNAELAAALSVPVIVVPAHTRTLPRRALLAIDFGRASVRAASAALDLLARPAHALMLSVGSGTHDDRHSHEDILFDAVQDALGPPQDVAIDRYRGSGDTIDTILRLAVTDEADLISVGNRGRWSPPGTRGRAIGHVARGVLATATCTVVTAPVP